MNIWFLVTLILIAYSSNSSAGKITLQSEKGDSDRIVFNGEYTVFNAEYANGLRVEGINLLQERLGKRWMLEFKNVRGTSVSYSKPGKGIIPIPTENFIELLDTVLADISKREDVGIDTIHLDLRLISELWNDIVLSVKKAASSNKGLVKSKDKATWTAMNNAIKHSQVLVEICALLKDYAYECDEYVAGTNPIAFQPPFSGQEWGVVINAEDAGISDSLWFGIDVAD